MALPTPDEAKAITERYEPLYADIEIRASPERPILLAHYTSVETAERILKNDEVWFSNPLYMNDLEEMRFGIAIGSELFPRHTQEAGQDPNRVQTLANAFNHYLADLQTEKAVDTYVFCLSELEQGHTDGLLSMWREYGRKGNGAALIFNTQRAQYQPHSPLVITKVTYASRDQRIATLQEKLGEWARITRGANLPDDWLYVAAYSAFLLVKMLALATKHCGFEEEREWRVIYVPERDPLGYLKPGLDYYIGNRGVEPKLRYKLGPILRPEAGSGPDLPTGSLSDILEFIMLGPSVSSPLAKASFIRMLNRIGKAEYADRVFSSTIPLRPQT